MAARSTTSFRTALQLLDAHEDDLEHLKEVADDSELQDLEYLS